MQDDFRADWDMPGADAGQLEGKDAAVLRDVSAAAVNPARRPAKQPKQDQNNVSGSDGAAPPSPVTPVRRISSTALAQELMDLTQLCPVRQGALQDAHCVFMRCDMGDGSASWIPTSDPRLHRFLSATATRILGRGPKASVIEEVIAHINGRGYNERLQPIARRVHWAREERTLWICLDYASQTCARITRDGWVISKDPTAIFQPNDGAGNLPLPVHGGSIAVLREFFPNVSDHDWPALLGFCLSAYMPEGALPVLVFTGAQGTGKSLATDLLRRIIDPMTGQDARGFMPKTPEDLYTIASSAHMVTLDNIGRTRADMSDALCVIATGGSFQTRKLFCQGQAHTLRARNPIILNGIDALPRRDDLLSRAVTIELQEIGRDKRRTEAKLWNDFDRALPTILGTIFDALSMALRDHRGTTVSPPIRMSDASAFVTAAEPALGLPDGAVVSSWIRTQDGARTDLSSSDPVVAALEILFERREISTWSGTSTDLSQAFTALEMEHRRLPTDLPREATKLGEHLVRQKGVLERAGYELTKTRTADRRSIRIERKSKPTTLGVTVVRPGSRPTDAGGPS